MRHHDRFDRALCRDNPELFDEKGGREPAKEFQHRLDRAEALCWQCPAREACKERADTLDSRDRSGIYAGAHHQWGRAA